MLMTNTILFKPNEKILSKITVSVCFDVWQLWLFVREFPIVVILNPSLKSGLISELVGLVE